VEGRGGKGNVHVHTGARGVDGRACPMRSLPFSSESAAHGTGARRDTDTRTHTSHDRRRTNVDHMCVVLGSAASSPPLLVAHGARPRRGPFPPLRAPLSPHAASASAEQSKHVHGLFFGVATAAMRFRLPVVLWLPLCLLLLLSHPAQKGPRTSPPSTSAALRSDSAATGAHVHQSCMCFLPCWFVFL
jgi:hypothetical protein